MYSRKVKYMCNSSSGLCWCYISIYGIYWVYSVTLWCVPSVGIILWLDRDVSRAKW